MVREKQALQINYLGFSTYLQSYLCTNGTFVTSVDCILIAVTFNL